MYDMQWLRKNTEEAKKRLLTRGVDVDFTQMLSDDEARRALIAETEALKARRNSISSQIPAMKKEGKDTEPVFAEMKQVGETIKENDAKLAELEMRINDFVSRLPNLPDPDLAPGGKENNEVLKIFGDVPQFDFEPKNHIDLAESLDLIDYQRGAKLGGNGFWVYTRNGAKLEWALLNYFVEEHLKDGYEFMLVPHLLVDECGYAAGQFPKFRDDVFSIGGENSRSFLLPTAETALVNLHRDEILREDELPRKYFAYSPCYRREAGSYRAEERGMIRGHQFNKVEIVQYTRPEDSTEAFNEMVGKAAALMCGLGLHHQVSKLAAGDCSESMARTYDVEVWLPSMGIYKEVSSASCSNDYQARRGNMRFRRKDGGKVEFVHTLNASALATTRVFPAILEQFQNADGSVTVPHVLQKWFGADKILPQ